MSDNHEHDIELHFRHVDRDGNGLIDFEEFRLMLIAMGMNRSGEVMAHAFKTIDSNTSGQIDLSEFSHWWSRHADQSGDARSPLAEDSPKP